MFKRMEIHWNAEKNLLVKRVRGVSFEEVAEIIRAGDELDIIPHPTRTHQKIIVVRLEGYVHAVPFVMEEDGIFLKTIYPSRSLNEQYGGTP